MASLRWYDGPLRAMLIEPGGAVSRELVRRAVRVESAAKGICPVDTGRLRSSIRWTTGVGGFERDVFVASVVVAADTGAFVTIGSDVEYAGYVELGTRYMRAQPYLRPSLAAAGPGRMIS